VHRHRVAPVEQRAVVQPAPQRRAVGEAQDVHALGLEAGRRARQLFEVSTDQVCQVRDGGAPALDLLGHPPQPAAGLRQYVQHRLLRQRDRVGRSESTS
jgi:hypothetical protein